MKKILIIGAGRSSDYLINYLGTYAPTAEISITLADADIELARKKSLGLSAVSTIQTDVKNESELIAIIQDHDIVISMLPAFMHFAVAEKCLNYGKHLFTASYVSKELKYLENDVKKKGLLFMNECGLDPGIDHMSAMKIIHQLKDKSCRFLGFHSWCGGLVAKESNTNPWGYKFSWNPRNVILAGKGTAIFRKDGWPVFMPYHRLFLEHFTLNAGDSNLFDAYPNRDSLAYEKIYGLDGIPTLIRGTLRYEGYCKAWHILADIGLTDENAAYSGDYNLHQLALFCLGLHKSEELKPFLQNKYRQIWNKDIENKLEYIGLFTHEPLPRKANSLADALQSVLEIKWKLDKKDKDRVVMIHEILFEEPDGKKKKLTSWLDLTGESSEKTAMAKTVGLPLAIAVKLFVENKTTDVGIVIPIEEKWYNPILLELEKYDIVFLDKEEEVSL